MQVARIAPRRRNIPFTLAYQHLYLHFTKTFYNLVEVLISSAFRWNLINAILKQNRQGKTESQIQLTIWKAYKT
jgi:hypothetical protein